jgi:hypothetical protein
MEDTELREHFHGIIARMERFEVRMDSLEKALTDFKAEVRGRFDGVDRRFEGLENRLSRKADTSVMTLYAGLILVVMGLFKFVL